MDRRNPNPDIESVRECVIGLVDDIETMSKELQTLKSAFDTHEAEEAQKFDAMINAVNQNTTSIDKLTTETKAIVELHRDAKGVINIASGLQKFALWVTKWGAVGTGIYLAIKWVRENFEWTNLL